MKRSFDRIQIEAVDFIDSKQYESDVNLIDAEIIDFGYVVDSDDDTEKSVSKFEDHKIFSAKVPLIDCYKYPRCFKKYIKYIDRSKNDINQKILTEIDLTKVNLKEQNIDVKLTISFSDANKVLSQNNNKNSRVIDFKKNKGLIGMKIRYDSKYLAKKKCFEAINKQAKARSKLCTNKTEALINKNDKCFDLIDVAPKNKDLGYFTNNVLAESETISKHNTVLNGTKDIHLIPINTQTKNDKAQLKSIDNDLRATTVLKDNCSKALNSDLLNSSKQDRQALPLIAKNKDKRGLVAPKCTKTGKQKEDSKLAVNKPLGNKKINKKTRNLAIKPGKSKVVIKLVSSTSDKLVPSKPNSPTAVKKRTKTKTKIPKSQQEKIQPVVESDDSVIYNGKSFKVLNKFTQKILQKFQETSTSNNLSVALEIPSSNANMQDVIVKNNSANEKLHLAKNSSQNTTNDLTKATDINKTNELNQQRNINTISKMEANNHFKRNEIKRPILSNTPNEHKNKYTLQTNQPPVYSLNSIDTSQDKTRNQSTPIHAIIPPEVEKNPSTGDYIFSKFQTNITQRPPQNHCAISTIITGRNAYKTNSTEGVILQTNKAPLDTKLKTIKLRKAQTLKKILSQPMSHIPGAQINKYQEPPPNYLGTLNTQNVQNPLLNSFNVPYQQHKEPRNPMYAMSYRNPAPYLPQNGNNPPPLCDVYPNRLYYNYYNNYGVSPASIITLPPPPPPPPLPQNISKTANPQIIQQPFPPPKSNSIIGSNHEGLIHKINLNKPKTSRIEDAKKDIVKVEKQSVEENGSVPIMTKQDMLRELNSFTEQSHATQGHEYLTKTPYIPGPLSTKCNDPRLIDERNRLLNICPPTNNIQSTFQDSFINDVTSYNNRRRPMVNRKGSTKQIQQAFSRKISLEDYKKGRYRL